MLIEQDFENRIILVIRNDIAGWQDFFSRLQTFEFRYTLASC